MLVAGRLLVAGRWRSIGSAPPGKAASAARTAGVRVDGVCLCVGLWLCAFVCSCLLLLLFVVLIWLQLWLWFVVFAVFVGGVP